jgi:hypothetical protein
MLKKFSLWLLCIVPMIVNAQNPYDVVISELLPDPTPLVGLPNLEWIELRNNTSSNITLTGWRIADQSGVSGAMPAFILRPDSFVIVTTSSGATALSAFGPTISVTSFPSLDNDGDVITLRAPSGRTIHAVAYTTDWYQNTVKADGGWSLEMIDPRNPCGAQNNWRASTNTSGGTPGRINSINAINVDNDPPRLLYTSTNNATQIVAWFNEPLDSALAANTANYSLVSGLAITQALPQAPLFNRVVLTLATALASNTVYNLTVRNVTDCRGNAIGGFNTARSGLPVDADSLNLIVNEILFNPKPNGFDYVETYNNSSKIFDANKLFIANRSSVGAIANVKRLSEQPLLIFPGDYFTVTESAFSVSQNYLVKNPELLITLPSLPSFNDDDGTVILLNFQGKIVDELNYQDDWHFALIDNEEGISLERLSADNATNRADNWHSASSTSGGGTPTAKNSQSINGNNTVGTVNLSNNVFSPDNDGADDVLAINYQIEAAGYSATVTIYNASGIPVRLLRKNELVGVKGSWQWDGLDDKRQKLPTGQYIIYVEFFNLQGKKSIHKKVVTLARRLN